MVQLVMVIGASEKKWLRSQREQVILQRKVHLWVGASDAYSQGGTGHQGDLGEWSGEGVRVPNTLSFPALEKGRATSNNGDCTYNGAGRGASGMQKQALQLSAGCWGGQCSFCSLVKDPTPSCIKLGKEAGG